MKIGIRRIGPLGDLYGEKYSSEFFDNLWMTYLLNKLEPDDEVVWFDRMPVDAEGFDNVLSDLDAIIGAWIFDNMITEEILSKHPRLKYIGTISHGYSEFDKLACKRHNVTVTNTHFNDYAVAQHTIALLLEIAVHIGENCHYYKEIKWNDTIKKKNKLFTRQMELCDKTIGIIGLGSIGFLVAKMATGLGMNIVAYDKVLKTDEKFSFIKQVNLETLLSVSDIITMHCASTSETKHMINKETINYMKKGVILLNCARGDLIQEQDLVNALDTDHIYAVGLDVLEGEPLNEPSMLLKHPKAIATEHIAWATPEARVRSVTVACENFLQWRKGFPQSVIS